MRNFITEGATVKTRAQRLIRDMEVIVNDKDVPDNLKRAVENLRGELKKKWADLETEAKISRGGRRGLSSPKKESENMAGKKVLEVSKTVGGVSHPASDFLVVEDPAKSSTWHLQVKNAGKVDRRLMGAAWAALHGGYRGNKYEGPNKAQAIAALKKLYDAEGVSYPKENEAESAEYDFVEGDYYNDWTSPVYTGTYVPYGVISFAQLETIEQTQEMAGEIRETTGEFTAMVSNIMYAPESMVPDKIAAMQSLFSEFIVILEDLFGNTAVDMSAGSETGDIAGETGETEPAGEPEAIAENLAESALSGAVLISDPNADDSSIAEADSKPLEVAVQIIRPGWGNTRDNHYYPAEMLRRDAEKFIGAKMYETDHREDEKSTRTWVSTVKEITGFTDDGAPIANVIVHDPSFGERIRNLNTAGMLDRMECSILANGKAKGGFEKDGRKGKVVEAITDVSSVDWVTRAGAGGKALSLAENEPGTQDPETETETVPNQDPANVENTEHETEPAADNQDPQGDPAGETEPENSEPVFIEREVIAEYLKDSKLPKPTLERILAGKYAGENEVLEAIARETAYIKELTGSGRVFNLGENRETVRRPKNAAGITQAIDGVNKKYFGG